MIHPENLGPADRSFLRTLHQFVNWGNVDELASDYADASDQHKQCDVLIAMATFAHHFFEQTPPHERDAVLALFTAIVEGRPTLN